MNLFQAIREGAAIRLASYQERFCYVEGRGLTSDVWGAACEAVHPEVAKLNWNLNDKLALLSSLRYLNEIQHKYFEAYFSMPATCPFAKRSMFRGHGRILNHKGEYALEEGGKIRRMAGVTSECHKVQTLAGFVDHFYYKHGNTREEIADLVEVYEKVSDQRVIVMPEHYQSNQIAKRLAQRSFTDARQRMEARRNGRRVFAGY